jgi:hypothetical protein
VGPVRFLGLRGVTCWRDGRVPLLSVRCQSRERLRSTHRQARNDRIYLRGRRKLRHCAHWPEGLR